MTAVVPAPSAVPEPFAWRDFGADDGAAGVGGLERARVVQCALSRICGACGTSLGRPIAFLGTRREADRNSFHCPPLHASCAWALAARPDADPAWLVVTAPAFEFVRPAREDLDRRPHFEPHR